MRFRFALIAVALSFLGACVSPTPTLDDASDDALASITFPAPTPALRTLRSAYLLGAVSLYAAHAIEEHSGPGAAADAERFLYRLGTAARGLADLRERAQAGRYRHFQAALYTLQAIELAELAVEPAYRSYRAKVIGLVAVPDPLAIAKTAGGALEQISRVAFVRAALTADAREHAAQVSDTLTPDDWSRAIEPISYACRMLAAIARRDDSTPAWCGPSP